MMLATEAIFTDDLDNLNVDAAVAALEKAGYEVHRLPEKYRKRLDFPGEAFLEVRIEGHGEENAFAHMKAVNAIVSQYGGGTQECWVTETGPAPFADWG